MEFTNEIFFNKNLVKNETILMTYSGKLYREHSAEVIIVYGYGENWEHTQEQKMTETENGFEVSIELKNYNTFNFCFRNNYDIWDNNSGFNYIASIEEKNQIEEEQEKQNEIIEEKEENKEIDIDKEIEETFNELLNSMLKFNESINSCVDYENGFGLQSVDEITEISSIECDDEILQELYENNSIENNENSNVQTEVSETSELENLLNALIERQNYEQNEDEEEENESINVEELNKLMNNLNSIIKENTEQDLELSENVDDSKNSDSDEAKFKISELPVEQKNSEDFLDNIIDKSYNFFQKIWVGCKKIGTLIKQTAKNLLGEEK